MTSGDASGFDSAEFRRVLGQYPTGVTVVTALCDDGPAGLAIGSFTSVSLDPPLVSFCPGHSSTTWARMRSADAFCVNVLGEDQAQVCSVFASSADDRFDSVTTRVEATGAPVIDDCLAWIDCRLHAVYAVGDHDIVVGEVLALGSSSTKESPRGPLLFFGGGFGRYQPLDS